MDKPKWSLWLFGLTSFFALLAMVIGIREAHQVADWTLLSAGIVGLTVTVAAWGISHQMASAGKRAAEAWEQFNTLFTERMQQFSVMLNEISEQQLLSDRGKSVAFRDKDREVLNRAIREEMARGQYDVALVLINDMDTAFGYKQEADKLREEIASQYDAALRRAVNEATGAIDRACHFEKWDEAAEIANRLSVTYPNQDSVAALSLEVQRRKEAFKQQLLARWRDAVARKDSDASIEVLQQLDSYVTAEEVAQLKEGAVEIFKARIEGLREQFKQRVHDKQWNQALAISQDITVDFPNSKLAQEVRDMMDMLRSKAAEESSPVSSGV